MFIGCRVRFWNMILFGINRRVNVLVDGFRRIGFWFWIYYLARERTVDLEFK